MKLVKRIARLGMRMGKQQTHSAAKARDRRGAAAVEFAVVAPVLVAIMMGLLHSGRGYEAKNLLEGAAREGARFATMDRSSMPNTGQTANQKLTSDVKNFLATNGIPKQDVTVTVKDADVPTKDFNLDDPNNDLKLFSVNVSVKFSDVSLTTVSAGNDYTLMASVVFRNARAVISN
jgi:Flp pilus assembly protein TadG